MRIGRAALTSVQRLAIKYHLNGFGGDVQRLRALRASGKPVRLFVLARHGESTSNVAGIVSSDPGRPVGLTPRGRDQARQLGAQLAGLDIELAVCSSFLRAQETVAFALRRRRTPVLIDRCFDEVRAGDFDGQPMETYWSWQQRHDSSERLPRGESMDEALLRYADALRRLLSRTEAVTLLVVHEFALRRIALAATIPSSLPDACFGNALPYLFDEPAIGRAAAGLEASAQSDPVEHRGRAMAEREDLRAPEVGGVLPCP